MISVIVPIYNAENYLKNCISSICNQSYADLQILLIDDGSTDSSLSICKTFADLDPRIQIVTKENGGQSSARNVALDIAGGQYIAFVDSDDSISADIFAKAIENFKEYIDVDVVQFPIYMNYGASAQYLSVKKKKLIKGKEDLFREWIEMGNISWIVCNKVFRKEVFDGLRFQNMYYEDNYIIAEILARISSLYITEEGIYYYYRRDGSTTTSAHSFEKEIDTQKVNYKIYGYVQTMGLDIAAALMQVKILNVGISLLENYQHSVVFFASREVRTIPAIQSGVEIRQLLKLLLYKFLGTNLFLKLYVKPTVHIEN